KRFENGLINSTEFNAAKTQMQNQQFQMISSKYEYIFRMKIMELYQGKKIILE
ncbi:MAG: outer membrane protein, partial [Patiriisocius sp.]